MTDDTEPNEPSPVEVRRNVLLSGVVGALAAALAVAFGVRAFADAGSPAWLDWVAFGVLGVIVLVHLVAIADGRAPLLVADRHGVRLRHGATWQGVAWDDVECLEHFPRRRLVRDGHLLVVGADDQQLVVPLTLATTLAGARRSTLSDDLAALADGRADVVEVVPGLDEEEPPEDGFDQDDDTVERMTPIEPVEPVDPVEPTGSRGTAEHTEHTEHAVAPVPADEETVRLTRVAPEDAAPRDVADSQALTMVIEEAPAAVGTSSVGIGSEVAAARQRLRLTVDQLSERTRIRPHVLESIEEEDFAPCGGDFYARGHLRTLARVLGIDAAPLVATYDETHAEAPVDPRRVFESELATGSIRSTRGGRNWSVLVAAVMAAVLVWSVARLAMDSPEPVGDDPVLNQSGGITKAQRSADAVPVRLTAVGGGANVKVRDGSGDVVFDSSLAFGQSTELDVVPPVRIWTSDGSVTAALDDEDAAALGTTGEEASKTLVAS